MMPRSWADERPPAATGKPFTGTAGRTTAGPARAAEEVWFPSESGGGLAVVRRPDDSDGVPDHEQPGSRRRDLSSVARWALPMLSLLVVLESACLVSGFVRTA